MNDAGEPPRPKRLFKKRWLTAGAVAVLATALWLTREPLADRFIRGQFDSRGIAARYKVDKIGFMTERLTDVAIGDPTRPDLTAKMVEVSLGYGFSGPYVSGVRAEGVRLYGRFADGQLSFGALDRFRDPNDKTPFALPDLSVVLSDARARIETPWGNVGAALNGGGNLRKDFAGKLALVAPSVTAAGCRARNASFYGAVTVRNVRPRLVGPLRGTALSCADGKVSAAAPQIALDLSLSEDLKTWGGNADASIAQLAAGSVRADRLGVLARFAGNVDRTTLDLDAHMARLRSPDLAAETVDLKANGAIGKDDPSIDGSIRFARASASAALRRSIAEGGRALDGSPLGPLAAKAGAALALMLSDTGGSTRFALTGQGRTQRFELVAPALTSASGAHFTGSEDSRIAYLFAAEAPTFIAAGRWSFGGGDLPTGTLALDRRIDGTISGSANIEPYAAAGSRLALAPVRFSGDRNGILRFATRADLSGPLGDGRVDGLTIPLEGTLSPAGAVTLHGGCTRVGADRIAVAGLTLARPAIDLCSRAGAPLLTAGPGGLSGQVNIPHFALRGTSGSSPFAFDAGRGAVDLASMRWSLAGADVRLGAEGSVTHFAAEALSGRPTADGMGGELTGARGKIGAVPLDMSEIAGQWRWAKGVLSLDGGLTVTDAQPDARFAPLVSDDAALRYAGGTIDATASLRERKSGVHVLDTVIQHALGAGTGHADIKVPELRFNDRFQPDQLTHLALGVVANVQGSVVGDGRIDWSPQGVTSHGTFATSNTNLAAAFGPVTGLTATLTFDDLINLHSAPGQVAKLSEINPGIPVIDGEIEYQLLGGNRIRIEGGRWPFAGGELLLHPTTLDFNAAQSRRLTFDLVGVNAAVFLQQFGFENINATGLFDGSLPVEFDGLGGRIVDGRIDARPGGGTLAYVGELSNHNLGAVANFAFGALRSLKYDDLTIIMNGDLDGEMVTDIRFGGVGQGEGATRNFLTNQVAKLPFVFNVKIQAPFRQLITSAKGFYDPTILIEQNLPALLRVQQDAEAAGADAPVQPPESEPMP